jgi:hypothetical protein
VSVPRCQFLICPNRFAPMGLGCLSRTIPQCVFVRSLYFKNDRLSDLSSVYFQLTSKACLPLLLMTDVNRKNQLLKNPVCSRMSPAHDYLGLWCRAESLYLIKTQDKQCQILQPIQSASQSSIMLVLQAFQQINTSLLY